MVWFPVTDDHLCVPPIQSLVILKPNLLWPTTLILTYKHQPLKDTPVIPRPANMLTDQHEQFHKHLHINQSWKCWKVLEYDLENCVKTLVHGKTPKFKSSPMFWLWQPCSASRGCFYHSLSSPFRVRSVPPVAQWVTPLGIRAKSCDHQWRLRFQELSSSHCCTDLSCLCDTLSQSQAGQVNGDTVRAGTLVLC